MAVYSFALGRDVFPVENRHKATPEPVNDKLAAMILSDAAFPPLSVWPVYGQSPKKILFCADGHLGICLDQDSEK
jgi:hypothetical protein